MRRDLRQLSDQRLLERTHGGAVLGGLSIEVPLQHRIDQRSPPTAGVHTLVTDVGAPASEVDAITAVGVQVTVV